MAYVVQYLADASATPGARLGFQFADRLTHPGRVWINATRPTREIVAERVALCLRIDKPDALVRVHAIPCRTIAPAKLGREARKPRPVFIDWATGAEVNFPDNRLPFPKRTAKP